MDFITGLPSSREGYDGILTVVDYLSKMAHFIPYNTQATAQEIMELFADRVIRYHGFPERIVSDRDPKFTSAFWEAFCARFHIKRALSTAFHPQTDGQTERANRTIEQMLRTYIQSNEEEWPNLLPALELAYNCTLHTSTGLTPFEVMIGENPLRAHDIEIADFATHEFSPPMTKAFQMLVDRAGTHILHAQQLQQAYANRKRKHVEFEVGTKVWVSTKYMQQSGCPKFQQRYIGPFTIIRRIGAVAYELQLPDSLPIHNVFHVSLLTKDKPRPREMQTTNDPASWQPIPTAEGEEYEVEFILDERGSSNNKQYLVKWKGYPEDEATWIPEANITNAKEVLRAFRTTRGKKSRKRMRCAQQANLLADVSALFAEGGGDPPNGESHARHGILT